jgi:hypothetical protein
MVLGSSARDRDPSRHDLAERLRNSQLLAELSLLPDEIVDKLALAQTVRSFPVVVHRGRLVFSDAFE